MRICPNCNEQLNDDVVFCTKCGMNLNGEVVPQSMNQQGYNQQVYCGKPNGEAFGLAITAMILGIIGFLFFCIPYFAIFFSIVAIIMGFVVKSKNSSNKVYKGKGFMIAALIVGFFGALVNLILLIGLIIAIVVG